MQPRIGSALMSIGLGKDNLLQFVARKFRITKDYKVIPMRCRLLPLPMRYLGHGVGDIGQHFSPNVPEWRNANSAIFLAKAYQDLQKLSKKFQYYVTLIGEQPKFMPYADKMRKYCRNLSLSARTGFYKGHHDGKTWLYWAWRRSCGASQYFDTATGTADG